MNVIRVAVYGADLGDRPHPAHDRTIEESDERDHELHGAAFVKTGIEGMDPESTEEQTQQNEGHTALRFRTGYRRRSSVWSREDAAGRNVPQRRCPLGTGRGWRSGQRRRRHT